tara:strand:- start:1032 stop:1727 length:696 start_codon:yes stop_codon:yes gene_type:complete
MKKIHKIVLLLLISQNLLAQRYNVPLNLPNYDNKPVHFGFLVGLNTLDFKLTSISDIEDELFVIQSQNQKGFNLGVVSNFRLANSLDFRFIPTLSLAERKIFYTINENNILINENKKIESTFIEFPLSLKYKSSRYNNGKAYIITGLKYSIDLASQGNIDDDGLEVVKIKQNDFLYEIGLGLDFYLPYFKFSPELKANFGLRNLIVNDGSIYSRSIREMKTRGFSISFTFE